MAKGNGDSMSDEEKEIDIESDEVNKLFRCDGLRSHEKQRCASNLFDFV